MPARAIDPDERCRDGLVSAEITKFVREFQSIEIRVATMNAEASAFAFVHPPYMLQSVSLVGDDDLFSRLEDRHRTRLQRVKDKRESASENVRCFLQERFFEADGVERTVASGRAELAEIQLLLQAAVDQGLVAGSAAGGYPDGCDLRKWLKTYGVGVDCSGFVQQALKRLVEAAGAEAVGSSGDESWLTKSFLRCQSVYDGITGSAESVEQAFTQVGTPAEIRPGDVLVSRRHMRIVLRAKYEEGGIAIQAAESTSARDFPARHFEEEDDIGPRFIQLKYTKPNQPIAKQDPLKKRLVDDVYEEDGSESTFVIGRCREMESSWSESWKRNVI